MTQTIVPRCRKTSPFEWPTLALILAVYAVWLAVVLGPMPLVIAVPALTLALTLHSSLQHEVIHGHPLPWRWVSVAMVHPPLGLAIPYERFRDLHLAHHLDARLTDPYDDPESCYLHPDCFYRLPRAARRLLVWNNTLAGRMMLGPLIGLIVFWADEAAALARGKLPGVWALHAVLVGVILTVVAQGQMPLWAYFLSAYLALSILKIRTYLEHRAHEVAAGRSVIIEDRGPLALLFLNNNYHAVHHAHPGVAWYQLPRLFAEKRDMFLKRNRGYYFDSYVEVFRHFLWRVKEPVAHPLLGKDAARRQ